MQIELDKKKIREIVLFLVPMVPSSITMRALSTDSSSTTRMKFLLVLFDK